jgi:hypothetical protein
MSSTPSASAQHRRSHPEPAAAALSYSQAYAATQAQHQAQHHYYQSGTVNPYAAGSAAAVGFVPEYHGRGSDDGHSDTASTNSGASIDVVPFQKNEADGYNNRLTPSGYVVQSVSGQAIEFFEGAHLPAAWKVPQNGRVPAGLMYRHARQKH